MSENKALLITLGSMLALAFLMFYVQPLWYGIRYGLSFMYNLGFVVFGNLEIDNWHVFSYTWEKLTATTEAAKHIGETYQKAFFLIGAFGWLLSARLTIVYLLIFFAGLFMGVIQ
jgi:hypothetical protein